MTIYHRRQPISLIWLASGRGATAWLGIGSPVRPAVDVGVRLDPDTQPDPRPHPTDQLTDAARVGGAVTTDPCLGVSPGGATTCGGAGR
jgi:hypothetical protein